MVALTRPVVKFACAVALFRWAPCNNSLPYRRSRRQRGETQNKPTTGSRTQYKFYITRAHCYTRESIHLLYKRLLSLVLVTTLSLLGTELEMLSSLEGKLLLGLALLAFQTEDDLTGSLGLLVEDGLGLTTEAHLLGVISALALGEVRGLAGLVLGDLVHLVLLALLACAVGLALLWYVNHLCKYINKKYPCKSVV